MENENTGMDLLKQSASIFDQIQAEDTQQEEREETTQAIESDVSQMQGDPRDKESWGLPAVAEEVKSAIIGGIQDTAHSVQTFPERVIDTVSGEVEVEQ